MANENEEYDYKEDETQGDVKILSEDGNTFPSNTNEQYIRCVITVQKVEG